jgi:hypothetical protein
MKNLKYFTNDSDGDGYDPKSPTHMCTLYLHLNKTQYHPHGVARRLGRAVERHE